MNSKNIKILLTITLLYVIIKFLPFGNYILYPVNLIVTFLHEFGHTFFAYITGGMVLSIQVNTDGSGLAYTSGGIKSLVLMGGYIGSALFGNLLLYFGLKSNKVSESIIYVLGGLMIFCSIFLYSGLISSIILILIGISLIYIANKLEYDSVILSFLGLASIFHIIADFRVGPSGDLAKFSSIFVFIPQFVWMYIWLFIVIVICFYNFKIIFYGKND
ncbi:MAG: M50 family metallopeptidase [Candidatus Gracilibacteria bacterium]|nr:M50 family metallopeptidase [Candidatus Gracilibacteria bacterium]